MFALGPCMYSLQVAKALYSLPSRTEDAPPEAAEPEEPSDRPPPPEDRPNTRPTRSSAPREIPHEPRRSDRRSRSPLPRRAEFGVVDWYFPGGPYVSHPWTQTSSPLLQGVWAPTPPSLGLQASPDGC